MIKVATTRYAGRPAYWGAAGAVLGRRHTTIGIAGALAPDPPTITIALSHPPTPETSHPPPNPPQRYDVLSTGVGALAVTGYCVARGQDPATAAAITVTATVVALVANEVLFETKQ